VKLLRDRVRSLAQRLLNTAIPVGLDQVLEIPAVGRSGVRNVCLTLLDFANDATGAKGERTVVGEPSLKLSFVPLVVDCDDVSSQPFFFAAPSRDHKLTSFAPPVRSSYSFGGSK
jgi:hypothetical protein